MHIILLSILLYIMLSIFIAIGDIGVMDNSLVNYSQM